MKNKTSDILFIIQILAAIVFGGGQFIRMWTTTEGVNISYFVFWEIALILNLILAVKANKVQSSKVTKQVLITYVIWIILVTADLAVMIIRKTSYWDFKDDITSLIVGIGILSTLVIAKKNKLGIKDPMVNGYNSMFFKAVPQLTMAYKIALEGSRGLAGTTVLAGIVTNSTRLGQLISSVKEAGWDRNRKGGAISEFGSTLTWYIISIVWAIKTF